MRTCQEIVFASNNRHKYEECQFFFAQYPEINLQPAENFIRNVHKINDAEKYNTYLENALAKARIVNHACHYPTLADDSGIEITALHFAPGPQSKHFATVQPKMTQEESNISLVLEKLQHVANREAKMVCTVALVLEGLSIHATGELTGMISYEPRGNLGFGYGSIFIPVGYHQTLAELGADIKNKISHRLNALQKLMAELKEYNIRLTKP
jgi:XTP/dITP diphosphohydrolase